MQNLHLPLGPGLHLTGGRREKDQRVSIHEENFSGREGTRNGKRIRRDMEESEERLRAETEDHQIRAIDGFDCRTTDATSTHTRVVNCIERERERERERESNGVDGEKRANRRTRRRRDRGHE